MKGSDKKIGSFISVQDHWHFFPIIQAEMDILQTDVRDLGGALALGAKVVKSVALLGETYQFFFFFWGGGDEVEKVKLTHQLQTASSTAEVSC